MDWRQIYRDYIKVTRIYTYILLSPDLPVSKISSFHEDGNCNKISVGKGQEGSLETSQLTIMYWDLGIMFPTDFKFDVWYTKLIRLGFIIGNSYILKRNSTLMNVYDSQSWNIILLFGIHLQY